MNQIEAIKAEVEKRVPGVEATLQKSIHPSGYWFLDFFIGEELVVNVEWRPNRGFGISSMEDKVFNEGCDEILTEVDATARRVVELLQGKGKTALPEEVSLKELRVRQKLSQEEFAQRLNVSQASVSELESDPSRSKLSTLLKAVSALGAKLEVIAVLSPTRTFKLKL